MVQNNLIKKIVGIISIILFTFFLAFFVFAIIDGYRIRNDIEFNGINSTGKYISNETWKKGIDCYFTFNINGKRYKGHIEQPKTGFIGNIGKFYNICYSKKFKGQLKVYFYQEVQDTVQILNAGFSMDDIIGNEKNIPIEPSFKEEIFMSIGIK